MNRTELTYRYLQVGTTYDGLSGQFFRIFEIIIFCFFIAMSDLMHDVEDIHGLCLTTANGTWNFFSEI